MKKGTLRKLRVRSRLRNLSVGKAQPDKDQLDKYMQLGIDMVGEDADVQSASQKLGREIMAGARTIGSKK